MPFLRPSLTVALSIAAALPAAMLFSNATAHAEGFDPALGDQRQYFVGLRLGADSPVLQREDRYIESVMRYRVDTDVDAVMAFDIEPRYLMISAPYYDVLFDSASPETFETAIARAMAAGFELQADSRGHTTMTAHDSNAWQALSTGQDDLNPEQFTRAFGVPGIMAELPPTVGATVTVGGLHPLSDVTLTVTEVTDQWITADLSPADKAEPGDWPLPGGDVAVSLSKLEGRVKVERDTGWIESLALFAEQTGQYQGQAVTIPLTLAMQALDDEAALGEHAPSMLYHFETFADPSEEEPGQEHYDLDLPQRKEALTARNPRQPDDVQKVFPEREGRFRIDVDQNALTLRVPIHLEERQFAGGLSLNALTLQGADGEALALPLRVTSNHQVNSTQRGQAIEITLRPLGWESVDWSTVQGVTATLAYRPVTVEEHLFIELGDEPTSVQRGDAVARAIPIPQTSGEWHLELGNRRNAFIPDNSTLHGDIRVYNTNLRYDASLPPTPRSLIEGVSFPYAHDFQLKIEGDADRLPLVLTPFAQEVQAFDMTFTPASP
ncbi:MULTISPECIES: hypothetical protein [unclassified Halomonas]|uniref:hypothetical protein n=1 Tax=unclassified Halomonas TaxID=2609666 RepID=UPI00207676C2|nr:MULTISPECIES: hypothetical protein [unclassified Halomonas]